MLETYRFLLTDAESHVERYLQHCETPRQTLKRWGHRRPRNKVFVMVTAIVAVCFLCDVYGWFHNWGVWPQGGTTWISANAEG